MFLHYTLQCFRFSCSLKNFGFCFLSGQYNSAKKRLVQLAVLSGWHYQNKLYPEVEIGCDSSIIISFSKILCKFCFQRLCKIIKKGSLQCPLPIYCLIFFVTTTSILNPPPPPTHYHTLPYPKNLPTLAAWEIACQGKQRCQPHL